jgi:hypothetical protein
MRHDSSRNSISYLSISDRQCDGNDVVHKSQRSPILDIEYHGISCQNVIGEDNMLKEGAPPVCRGITGTNPFYGSNLLFVEKE